MRWVRRGLWAAAWGAWGLLGLGLYRELPRTLGPCVGDLNLSANSDRLLGFIGDSSRLAVARPTDVGFRYGRPARSGMAIEVFDLSTLRRTRVVAPPPETPEHEFSSLRFAPRFGVAFVVHYSFAGDPGEKYHGLNMLDVAAGEWRNIGVAAPEAILHRDRPWVAFIERPGRAQAKRLVVFDYLAGKRLLVRPNRSDSQITDRPFFLPERATLVIPIRSPGKHPTLDDVDFELWELGGPPSLPATRRGSRVGDRPSLSPTGRVAFGAHDPESIHVYGIDDERLLFSDVSQPDRPVGQTASNSLLAVAISRDARRVLGASRTGLWDVDGGRQVWRPNAHELPLSCADGAHFLVHEQWGASWKRWLPNLTFNIYALRRMEGAELVCRVRDDQAFFAPAGARVVTPDGSIHLTPHVVDYPLLALCQAILALPLVMLGGVLRWRKKRRLRIANLGL